MSVDNKIFCTAPFTTLRVETTPTRGLSYKPGCVYVPVNNIPTLNDFMTGEEITTLRDNVCNGSTFSEGCSQCERNESFGQRSIRMKMNEKPFFSSNLDIKLLDIAFSNICNMACFMCSPSYSSLLASERFNIGVLKTQVPYVDNTENALEVLDSLPNLESVSLIGGEFFIFKNNLAILEKIIEKNLECRIVTNASVITNELLSKLSELGDKLELQISVDGSHGCYDFMRYPNTWDTLSDNVRLLQKSLPYAKMNFQVIVQALNIQHLPSSLEALNKFSIPTSMQNLSKPNWLSWSILTDEEKLKLENHLMIQLGSAVITQKQKDDIVRFIGSFKSSSFNEEERRHAIDLLKKTFSYRSLSKQVVTEQLGIFDSLCEQLIN